MAEDSEELRTTTRDSIYRAARSIKRRELFVRFTKTPSLSTRSLSYGLNYLSLRTFVVVSGTFPDSTPPAPSNPPMVIPIICPLTLLASISIAGAGDDEESWARGLSPNVFWTHVDDLIHSGPDLCNQKVPEIVETIECIERREVRKLLRLLSNAQNLMVESTTLRVMESYLLVHQNLKLG